MKNIFPTVLQFSKVTLYLFLTINLISCASKKDILYFQDSETLNLEKINQDFDPIIETNDILHVNISSINEEVLRPFLKIQQIQSKALPKKAFD